MDPVTHFLTGACIGRAGLNRKTAYATLAAVLAAEAADLDIFWEFAGPVEGLKHHRGITHTFLGAPVVAAVVVGAIALLHLLLKKRRHSMREKALAALVPGAPVPAHMQEQPIHWFWLYMTSLIASLSHLLLDWTNNYGIRPFFPFNPHWYQGGLVYIIEPILLLLLLAAMIMPWIFGLADREIGVRKTPFRGQKWAIFTLVAMTSLWCWRWIEQAHAQALLNSLQVTTEPVKRVTMDPYPINPYIWRAVMETENTYQTAYISTWTGTVDSDPQTDILYKPQATAATEAAKQTPLGKAYLDWGTWAVVEDIGQSPVEAMTPPQLPNGRQWTTVMFRDLRFGYSPTGRHRWQGAPPLAAWVYIVDGHEVAGEAIGKHEQK